MNGIMNVLATPFAWVMRACYWFTGLFNQGNGNYVIALLLFALLMQILLCPFGIIQQRNSQKQAKMRPMEYLIRKKYAGRNDRATQQKMQNEIMELYQKEGYSPLAGCLPMLLQLVIIFPLYNVVIYPLTHLAGLGAKTIEILVTCFNNAGHAIDTGKSGYQVILSSKILNNREALDQIVKGYEEVKDASGAITTAGVDGTAASEALEAISGVLDNTKDLLFMPSVTIFGQDLGSTPFQAFSDFKGLWFLLFIPVINLALMYLSQFLSKKLNPQPMQQESDQQAGAGMLNSMKIMMWTMPLMTFFFTFMFPGAIGIYWIFRTLLSMLQQFIISRIFKLPKYTEEDLKRIEKEMKEAKRNAGKPDIVYNNGEAKPYRSLHHIDDDE